MESLQSDCVARVQTKVILERIFDFCDVSSLKNCRIVSKYWKERSLKSWREKAWVVIDHLGELKFGKFLNFINSDAENSLRLQKNFFLKYPDYQDDEDDEEQPDPELVAEAISGLQPHGIKMECGDCFDFLEFTRKYTPVLNLDSLQTLDIGWDSIDYSDGPFRPEVLLSCPNLKQLKLTSGNSLGREEEDCPGREIWRYFLGSFSRIESLSLQFGWVERGGPEYVYDWQAIVTQLLTLRTGGGVTTLPLKELEMIDNDIYQHEDQRVHRSIIRRLGRCQFPLQVLHFQVGWNNDEGILILPLLQAYRDRIQDLTVSINFNGPDRNLTPFVSGNDRIHMAALRKIRFLSGMEKALFFLAHLQLPQLNKLVVEYQSGNNPPLSLTVPDGLIFEGLQTLEVKDPHIPQTATVLKFTSMMPNLTNLTIVLQKSTFPLICDNLRALKTLHVLATEGDYGEIEDETVTGITKESTCRHPNITYLKDLSDLKILCKKKSNNVFTEDAFRYGFLELHKLYNLSVPAKGLSLETKEQVLRKIKGKVDLEGLIAGHNAVEIVSEDESIGTDESESDADDESVGTENSESDVDDESIETEDSVSEADSE